VLAETTGIAWNAWVILDHRCMNSPKQSHNWVAVMWGHHHGRRQGERLRLISQQQIEAQNYLPAMRINSKTRPYPYHAVPQCSRSDLYIFVMLTSWDWCHRKWRIILMQVFTVTMTDEKVVLPVSLVNPSERQYYLTDKVYMRDWKVCIGDANLFERMTCLMCCRQVLTVRPISLTFSQIFN
jgi:hypothetical protein